MTLPHPYQSRPYPRYPRKDKVKFTLLSTVNLVLCHNNMDFFNENNLTLLVKKKLFASHHFQELTPLLRSRGGPKDCRRPCRRFTFNTAKCSFCFIR